MRNPAVVIVAIAMLCGALVAAQDTKPVPKDSVRGSIPGCTKGYVFTAGPRTSDQVGRLDVPEGMHLRMNGPKKLMAEIKAHEGSMIEITGLMKKGQYNQTGINVGGGVRITPGSSPGGGSLATSIPGPIYVDVESWRQVDGNCPSR